MSKSSAFALSLAALSLAALSLAALVLAAPAFAQKSKDTLRFPADVRSAQTDPHAFGWK